VLLEEAIVKTSECERSGDILQLLMQRPGMPCPSCSKLTICSAWLTYNRLSPIHMEDPERQEIMLWTHGTVSGIRAP
jgi:hypothetical protein